MAIPDAGPLGWAKKTLRFLYRGLQAMALPYLPYHPDRPN